MTRPNLDIKPHHVRRGNEASKRSQEREKRLRAITLPDQPIQRTGAPFKRSGRAIADLTAALGYPQAVIPPMEVSRRHKAIPESDE